MRLKNLWINGFKNLSNFELNFEDNDGLTVLIGNNGSGKSNILEAISAIFAYLYISKDEEFEFEFYLVYELANLEISIQNFKKERKSHFIAYISSVELTLTQLQTYLPKNVIASYSGEESRLWKNYYFDFYKNYIDGIIKNTIQITNEQKMIFINKYHWEIALLTMLASDLGIDDILHQDLEVKNIVIDFNLTNLKKFEKSPNDITRFIRQISNEHGSVTYDISSFQDLSDCTHEELYKKLAISYLPKDAESKLITSIEIYFDDDKKLGLRELSEGEKKQIIIKFILGILADKNSLVLLDEPDTHVHIANKSKIKNLLFMDEENVYAETILTTHSPTLMSCFDDKHLQILDDGSLGDINNKLEAIESLTDGIWSYHQQTIILNTNKDLILVEGKTDIDYIKTALTKLKPTNAKYNALDFEFIPFGGTDSLQHFVDKFTPKNGQTIIAFLDRDDAGKKALKQVFGIEKDISTFNYEAKNNIFIAVYPKKDGWLRDNFLVEDFFDKEIIDKLAKDIINKYADSFKSYPNISKQIKDTLPSKCKDLTKDEFVHFKKLFDLILEIKEDGE